MKKTLCWILSILLLAALITACKKKTPAAPTAASLAEDPSLININSDNPLENLPAPTLPPENMVNLIQITSVIEPTDSGLKVQGIPVTFIPSTTDNESDYTLQGGVQGEYIIPFDTTIEFPITEDPAHSVAIMGEEFDGEFRTCIEVNHFYPLFSFQQSGSVLTDLESFYIP